MWAYGALGAFSSGIVNARRYTDDVERCWNILTFDLVFLMILVAVTIGSVNNDGGTISPRARAISGGPVLM